MSALTAAGRALAFVCVLFGISGAVLRYPAFLVVALGGVAALLQARVQTARPSPLDARIELAAAHGTRGQVVGMTLCLDNPTDGRTARCVVEVAVPFLNAPPVVVLAPALGPRSHVRVVTEGVPLRQRGSWTVGPAVVKLLDPLGLIARKRRTADGATIRVHPAFVVIPPPPSAARPGPAGRWGDEVRGQGLSFERLREYVWGDEVRAIHWPSVARTGLPLVRTFVEPGVDFCTVVLDVEPLAYGDVGHGDRDFEQAVEVAASVAVAAVRARLELRVIAGDDRLWPRPDVARTSASLLDALADVTLRPLGAGLDQRPSGAVLSGPSRGGPGVVVAVTGPSGGLADEVAGMPAVGAVVVRVGAGGDGTARVRADGALVTDVATSSELLATWSTVLDVQAGLR